MPAETEPMGSVAAMDFVRNLLTAITFDPDEDVDVKALLPRLINPDYVQITDGKQIGYDDFITHLEHLRSVAANGEFVLHHAILEGRSFAERHTVHVTMKAGGTSSFEVMMIGSLDEEGRLLTLHEMTRQLSGDAADADLGSAL